MFDKPQDKETIGLEQDGNLIKYVRILLIKGKPVIQEVCTFADGDEIQQLNTKLRGHLLCSAIDGQEVIVRPLDLKIKKEKDIDSVLLFQAEPLLPYPIDNAIIDRIKLTNGPEGIQLTVFSVQKEQLRNHVELWNMFQIDPEVVTCEQAALAAFGSYVLKTDQPYFIIHLGKLRTNCVLVRQGKIILAQTTPHGLKDLENAALKDNIVEPISSLDFTQFTEECKYPSLIAALRFWKLEIARLQQAMIKQRKGQEVSEMFFTGEGANCNHLPQVLGESNQRTFLNPEENFSIPEGKIHSFAIPVGTALCALTTFHDPLNFRQKEFAFAQPWKRLKKSLGVYFSSCVALALAIYLFGNTYLDYQAASLRQEYADLLASINHSYEHVEKDFSLKYLKQPDREIFPIDLLTQEEIAERLTFLHKDIKSHPDIFPLRPNLPIVSDLLAWLSTHPIFSNPDSGVRLESFYYNMVKYPEIKKTSEKYQVKVEIEFSSSTPKIAREFHDALIAPNEVVDPKGEVKWSSNKGKYKASFYLKDKTIYQTNLRTE